MPATRRDIVRGLAASAGVLCAPAAIRRSIAQSVQPGSLRGAEILPAPDFARLRKTAWFVAGVRPHRTGGVRLDVEPAITTPKGTKFLIHNYGHSGAGITLSWGCAGVVCDHVENIVSLMRRTKTRPSAAILGSGVIGLTVAAELRRKWHALPITVYAKTLDLTQTTSFIAGGQFEPSQIWREYQGAAKPVLEGYLERSAARIAEIERSGRGRHYGVALRQNYTLDAADQALDDFTPPDIVPAFKRGPLPFEALNVVGREYTTWLMNPRILLPRLKAELGHHRVRFRQKEFADRGEVEQLEENIIVNCTGFGARALFRDCAVQPKRGHLAILHNPARLAYFFSGGCGPGEDVVSYMFARQHDIVVGGTVIPGDCREHFDESDPNDRDICNRILDNAEIVFAGNPGACTDPTVVVKQCPPVPCVG
ncbi:MAG TPA: FAD-dependent oxidoreductase [Xanthobacteraceae bacterium]|nr:FAD-dependent oxidoreductase [Xanthobacteraceae bacterium]